MDCLVLAAGYATRLYPLTKNFPKPLLEVKGKSILDWLLDDIAAAGAVTRYIVVTNHRYYDHFVKWAEGKRFSAPVVVLDDGTFSNENRLGAVGDILFAMENLSLSDDLMVIAGDNVLDFSFAPFIRYFRQKQASCIMRYYEPDQEKIVKAAAVDTDDSGIVLWMTEKPAVPESSWCVPPFYIYAKGDLPLIRMSVAEGCNPDSPGSLAAWLSKRSLVYAMEMPGKRYDIGDLESYQLVQETYKGIIANSSH